MPISTSPVVNYTPSWFFFRKKSTTSDKNRLIIAVKNATYNDDQKLQSATFITAPNNFFGRTLQAALGLVSKRDQIFKDFIRAKYTSAVRDIVFEAPAAPLHSFNVAAVSRYDAMAWEVDKNFCSLAITPKLYALEHTLNNAKSAQQIDAALAKREEISETIETWRRNLETLSNNPTLRPSRSQLDKLQNYLEHYSFKLSYLLSEGERKKAYLVLRSKLHYNKDAPPQQKAAQIDEIVTAYNNLHVVSDQLIDSLRATLETFSSQSRVELYNYQKNRLELYRYQSKLLHKILGHVAETLFEISNALEVKAEDAYTASFGEDNPEKQETLKKEALFLAEKVEEAWKQTILHFDLLVTLLRSDSLSCIFELCKKESAESELKHWIQKAKNCYGERFCPLMTAEAIATPTALITAAFEKKENRDASTNAEVSAIPASSKTSTLPTASLIETTTAQDTDEFSDLSDADATSWRQATRTTGPRTPGIRIPSIYKTSPSDSSSSTASAT